MFGGPAEEPTTNGIIASAKIAGVNFIDTADRYWEGKSEDIVSRVIAHDHRHWILATKLANPTGSCPNDRGPSNIHAARIDRLMVNQPYNNAVNREPEVEHVPACAHYVVSALFPTAPSHAMY
ncbi:MAG TPA: aldo/keto reductase [Halothiobacillus sp.]|nr:aldo/keto reductase [Halothiobacillus sp.]